MKELKQSTPLQGGKYIIKRVLGQGGFGITYLAEQVSLGREVAIKEFFMKDNCERDIVTGKVTTGNTLQIGRYHAKFLKEARTLSGLSHPNIISIIDVFEENCTAYYAMPFMPNGSLSDLVKRNGPLQEDVALRYIKQIAQALKYMHNKHLCHFDVKPANILLDANDNAVLIDFGISKNYDAHGNETSTTPIGMSEGYAPLEQYQQMVSEFSPASDVYSLGGTLYYLVMGKVPPSAINIAQGADLELGVNLSCDTRNLIEMAMRTSSKQRLQNVDRFIKEEQNESPSSIQDVEWEDDEEDENTLKQLLRNYWKEWKWWMISGIVILLVLGIAYVVHNSVSNAPIRDLVNDGMVYVPGGTFTMGARDEQNGYSEERPSHEVTLSGYYISKYEVTQELWEAVMGNNPSGFQSVSKGSSKHPVEMVSWDDCQEFISKLNKITGENFRLPSEAEWGFAARGGESSLNYKYSDSNSLKEVAWFANNSDSSSHPVGTKKPNEFGLYDMNGNVWEWCQDWYGEYPNNSQTNPIGPPSGTHHVYRGGSWDDPESYCRISFRGHKMQSNERSNRLGLRLVMDAK